MSVRVCMTSGRDVLIELLYMLVYEDHGQISGNVLAVPSVLRISIGDGNHHLRNGPSACLFSLCNVLAEDYHITL